MITDRTWDITGGQHFLTLPGFLPGFETSVKLEGLNLAGSIKLKTARELILDAEQCGLLTADTELIESTSGNLGIALATICAARKYPLTLVTDPNTNAAAIRHMQALGANVVIVQERDDQGGYLKVRIEYIRRHLLANPKLVWLNQYANMANVHAHRKHTVNEILDRFGVPDWLFIGAGTTGTLMGCLMGLRRVGAPTRVVAVDSIGSVTFGAPASTRRIPGLGTSRRPEIFTDDGSFEKVMIPEIDTIRTCRRVAADYGLLLGGSSGTVLAGVAAMSPEIAPGSRVLTVSPDLGDRYLNTIYDDAWVTYHYGPEALTGAVNQIAVGRG